MQNGFTVIKVKERNRIYKARILESIISKNIFTD